MPSPYQKILNYSDFYQCLRVSEGCSWQELRKAYKRAAKQWHPDHFQDSQKEKILAEEQIKKINNAYEILSAHYKKHGALPVTQIPQRQTVTDSSADTPEPQPYTQETDKTRHQEEYSKPKRKSWRFWLGGVPASVAVVSLFYLALDMEEKADLEPQVNESPNKINPLAQLKRELISEEQRHDTVEQTELFTYGATLGYVHNSQGIPTRIDQNGRMTIWYYGNSAVYFLNGQVLKWIESESDPLNIDSETKHIKGRRKTINSYFGIGSTKREVRSIQGTPTEMSKYIWKYGLSSVYFKDGRVTKWHESQLYPLLVKK